jgi:uncharacterized membrane protein
MWILRLTIVAAAVLAALQALLYAPLLPDQVASHFDGTGMPNGWASKQAFFLLMLAVVGGNVALFLGLPQLITRIPLATISLPNRSYWLAPERRRATLRALERQLLLFGIATTTFLAIVFQLVIIANLRPTPRLDPRFGWILGGYLLFTIVWTLRLVAGHRRPT